MANLSFVAPSFSGGFEFGDLSDWTENVTANWDVIQSNGGLSAFEGDFFLQLGDGNDSGELEQALDVSGASTLIDNNTPLVRIKYQEAQSFTGETANIRLEFRDGAGGTVLGSAETGFHEPAGEDTWTEVEIEGNAPVGTREIAVLIQAGTFGGGTNNFSIDDILVSSEEDIFPPSNSDMRATAVQAEVAYVPITDPIARITTIQVEVAYTFSSQSGEAVSNNPIIIIVE